MSEPAPRFFLYDEEVEPHEWAAFILSEYDGPEEADAHCAGLWSLAVAIDREHRARLELAT